MIIQTSSRIYLLITLMIMMIFSCRSYFFIIVPLTQTSEKIHFFYFSLLHFLI